MELFGLSNLKKLYEFEDAYVVSRTYKAQSSSGMSTYTMTYYIPKKCTASTNTVVYSCGAGGLEFDTYLKSCLSGNKVDAIIAFPGALSTYNEEKSMQVLVSDLDKIHSSLGITNYNMTTIGHSSGGQSCLYFAIENIKNHPDIGPQTCIMVDPGTGTASGANGGVINSFSKSDLKLLGENGTTVIGFEHAGSDVRAAMQNYARLGKYGSNVVLFGVTGKSHVGIQQYALNRGALSYLAGDIPLTKVVGDSVSEIYVYDHKKGGFRTAKKEELKDYINEVVGTYGNVNLETGEYHSNVNFGDFSGLSASLKTLDDLTTITNDQGYVVGAMNRIRSGIKNSSVLNNTGGVSCSSTTFVPTCAENFLHDYFAAVLNLLNKLRMETEKAITVGTKLEESDEELAARVKAEQETIYVPISSSNIGSSAVASAVVPAAIAAETIATNQTVLADKERLAKLKPYSVNTLRNKNLCTKVYDITADDLNRLFDHWAHITGNYNSPLRGTGEAWIKACDATGLDPLTLVGICGEETGRGGFAGMDWMNQKNFFGMRYIDPTGDGTGRAVKWAGDYDLFPSVDDAIMASAKRIKNFYYGKYNCRSVAGLTQVGYIGGSKASAATRSHYSYVWANIMKESLDYITGTNGGK